MDVSSQVSQNKRSRDEYLNTGLPSPDAKRANSVMLGYDSDLMAFLEKIDNMENNEETDAVNEVESEMMLNEVIKSLEDENGLKALTYNDIESSDSTDERVSIDEMRSNKQGQLHADGYSEATSVTSDIGNFSYYDNVRTDRDVFLDNITPNEFGIMLQNYLDGDSVPDIMYSDTVHGYVESREISYGSLWENEYIWQLWEDDIWQLNEHPVIQSDFASPEQKKNVELLEPSFITANEKGL